jgi:putative ABC transport system substrate-binding protein
LKDAFTAGLRDLGWVDGQNIAIEWYRGAEDAGVKEAGELARHAVDVAVVGNPHKIRAAMTATATIPIVGIDLESDPVASGFVTSLGRPGRNVSGIWLDQPELAGKQLQFLREVVPSLKRVGVLWDDRIGEPQLAAAQAAARAVDIRLHPVSLHAASDADEAMRRLQVERPQAILALTAPVIFIARVRIAELARTSRLPSISPFSTYPAAGGLMAYGPDFPAIWRQAAGYVDRILKGARAGELPVERPSRFELIVNLKTAKAIGLTVPQSVLWRADEVIR